MTDELRGHGEGAYIQEFVAGGPKNYGFRVHNKNGELVEETSKNRGIRLNFKNKKTVNFDVIKSCVFEFCMQDNVHMKKLFESRISRNRNRYLLTETVCKSYRVVYTKRALFPIFVTLPFGY